MKIAVASGKGGTGKTTVAASLISVWRSPVAAVDLDVEEPNLHLFLNPDIAETIPANMEIPVVDETKCTYCRKCSELCQFKAISVFGEVALTFPEMCHGCGGCMMICPEGAVSRGERQLGDISVGRALGHPFFMGRLRVGEAMSPPLMRAVLSELATRPDKAAGDIIIDAPPGVSCPAVTAVMECDAIVLVTEPTPFGVYDLKLAHEAFSKLGKPMGVVVNRAGIGDDAVYAFCRDNGLPILTKIPYDLRIAEAYSKGRIVADTSESIRQIFLTLAEKTEQMARAGEERCHA
jgi:MinD superfamily P-loop ATPase